MLQGRGSSIKVEGDTQFVLPSGETLWLKPRGEHLLVCSPVPTEPEESEECAEADTRLVEGLLKQRACAPEPKEFKVQRRYAQEEFELSPGLVSYLPRWFSAPVTWCPSARPLRVSRCRTATLSWAPDLEVLLVAAKQPAMWRYNILKRSMVSLETKFLPHAAFAMHGGALYCMGGVDQGYFSNKVTCFADGKWADAPQMTFPLKNASAASGDDGLYVLGDLVCKMVEGGWAMQRPMIASRSGHASCSQGGRIFVLGGTKDRSAEFEMLDRGQWSVLPAPRLPRSFCTLVASGRHVYALGGYDGTGKPTSSVERFDTRARAWVGVAALPTPMVSPACTARHGSLWLFRSPSVFCFHAERWTLHDKIPANLHYTHAL